MSIQPSALTPPTPPNRARRGAVVGAVVAAFAASACCLGPAILAIVGLSGAGLAAALEAYRPLFLGATVVFLGLGFYLTYRRPRAAAVTDAATEACSVDGCEMPRAARSGRAMLWLATVAVVVFATYPYIAGAFATTARSGAAAAVANAATARIHIDGMDCKACTSAITRDLAAERGVIRAEVAYERGLATVTYDPALADRRHFIAVVEALGYRARIVE